MTWFPKHPTFKTPDAEPTVRLTVAQATIRFLANQYVERDGERGKFFAGCFGIFGHGNVAGIGQALLEAEVDAERSGSDPALRYVLGRNEQAMVHTAAAYARQKDRLQAWAVTASIGPGSTNMLTGAALATINRLPVLLLPSDTFATRVSAPGFAAAGSAPRRRTDGQRCLQAAVALLRPGMAARATPRRTARCDARADRPRRNRRGHDIVAPGCSGRGATTGRNRCSPNALGTSPVRCPRAGLIARAAEIIRAAEKPLIVAGGGVIYSGASEALAAFAEQTGIPVSETQAGKGSLPYDHPQSVGAVGSTGTTAANALAADADVVIGIGTRYSDFTSASRTAFNNPDVRFVNINVASFDAVKQGGCLVVADAREAIDALAATVGDYTGERRIPLSYHGTRYAVGRHRDRCLPGG